MTDATGELCRASPGELVVTEIMAAPLGESPSEWVEIHNASDVPQPLDGVALVKRASEDDLHARRAVLRGAGTLEPGGYAVVASRGSVGVDPVDVWTGSFGGLANDGAWISLECQEATLDAVAYGSRGVGRVASGQSLQLDAMWSPDAEANDRASRWCASVDPLFDALNRGTPGAANRACRQVRCLEGALERDVRSPSPGDLAVVEVLADASGGDTGREWLELEVLAATPVDLNGLDVVVRKIESGSERRVQLAAPECLVAEPGALLVVGSSADVETNGGVRVDVEAPGLSFFDGAAFEVRLGWGEDGIDAARLPAALPGVTWMLAPGRDPGLDNDAPEAFCAAQASGIFNGVGTPGCPNVCGAACVDASGCARPVRPPAEGGLILDEVFPNPDGDDGGREWIELSDAGPEPFDLNGLELISTSADTGRSRRAVIESERCLSVEPGERRVVAGILAESTGVPTDALVGGAATDLFYNGAADLAVVSDGTTLDRVAVPDSLAGFAYSRDGGRWCWPASGSDSFVGGIGTPGAPNASCP